MEIVALVSEETASELTVWEGRGGKIEELLRRWGESRRESGGELERRRVQGR